MKKILLALILGGLLAVLMLPMVVSAQTEPVKCCTLSQDIDWTSGYINDTQCPAVPCEMEAGDGVGATTTDAAACTLTGGTNRVTNQWGLICVLNGIYTITNWIFVILIAIATLIVIWGAFLLITAGGAPERVSSGRNFILYAMIGFAVALLARAVPSIVRALLGV